MSCWYITRGENSNIKYMNILSLDIVHHLESYFLSLKHKQKYIPVHARESNDEHFKGQLKRIFGSFDLQQLQMWLFTCKLAFWNTWRVLVWSYWNLVLNLHAITTVLMLWQTTFKHAILKKFYNIITLFIKDTILCVPGLFRLYLKSFRWFSFPRASHMKRTK